MLLVNNLITKCFAGDQRTTHRKIDKQKRAEVNERGNKEGKPRSLFKCSTPMKMQWSMKRRSQGGQGGQDDEVSDIRWDGRTDSSIAPL